MKQKILEEFRKTICVVHPLNDAEWELLSENVLVKQLKKNEMVHKAGENISNFVFLVDGAIRLYFIHNDKELTHQVYTNQRFIIDLISLKAQEPTLFYMEALAESWIIEISAEFINKLLSLSPTYEKMARVMYENAMFEEMYRVKELLSYTPFEHYSQFMSRNKELASQMTQTKIARCLNIAPETLSRFKQITQ